MQLPVALIILRKSWHRRRYSRDELRGMECVVMSKSVVLRELLNAPNTSSCRMLTIRCHDSFHSAANPGKTEHLTNAFGR